MPESDRESTKTKSSATASADARPFESTPLLPKVDGDDTPQWGKSVTFRVLFTAFLVSVSFSITQVPMIYAFGVFTCDEYYKTHPDPGPTPERCRITAIEASTARSVALVGAGTTLFGVLNLFYTGWAIKRFGIKSALLTSVFWPAVRLAVQNIGVQMGYSIGITIIQASQIITVVGGPAGYLLALNSFATEIVLPHERTATLGRLSGCSFFGTALGYLCGGLLSDAFGIPAPFEVTLVLFIVSCIWIAVALPSVPLHLTPENEKRSRSLLSFFEPLKMFIPRKWVLENGRVQKEYGILLLGVGASLAVLATGYIPVLLQMYSTDVLQFGTTENGWLISLNSLVRGLFLTFVFPVVITRGRAWIGRRQNNAERISREESAIPDLPTATGDFEPGVMSESTEPTEPLKPRVGEEESFVFDLYYTRYSILVDGILTGLATFTSQGWHMFLIALLLPLAAGTGSAAKGTILMMCAPEERADALSAISLMEMVGRLSSTGAFGLVFSAFATIGKPYYTFTCNAGVAVFAFVILYCAKFPPRGSRRVYADQDED